MNDQGEVKRGICWWCHVHCKVEVYVRDGQLQKVEEGKGHPSSEQYRRVVRACPRARAAAEWAHHPERLNYPLKRMGGKGEGKWQTISWEQALDEVAERLKHIKAKYGAEALAFTRGTHRNPREFTTRFYNLFGSPNIIGSSGSICWAPSNVMGCAIIGWPVNYPANAVVGESLGQKISVTKCILLIGMNPAQAHRLFWYNILDAQQAGAKLIVIDPRRTETAEKADIWLQLRPGTDTALLMAMINTIISEELYDKEFVNRWCHGFDKLAERAQEYTPEKVANITWVPAEKIREAARTYATAKPAVSQHNMGIEHLNNTSAALHARYILPAITGNLGVRGGQFIVGPHRKIIHESELELNDALPPEQKAKMLGSERAKLFSWEGYQLIQSNVKKVWGSELPSNPHAHAHSPTVYRTMLTDQPYPVKAMITMASNPLVSMPNTKLVYQALKKSELYVVMDYFMTPSAQLADYVFPAASWLERPTMRTELSGYFVYGGEAALPAIKDGEYERRSDYDFWRGLGIRLGQEEYWPWNSLEETYDYRLQPLGCTFKEFMSVKGGYELIPAEEKMYERIGFGTPTGKVELYSTILEKLGHDPLPAYREPSESPVSQPKLSQEYPLILITGGRFQPMYHSEWRQVESARRQHPQPIMQLNPKTAAELGIDDGDWVWIETLRGRIRQKCQYFEGIESGVAHAEHGWWFPELPGEEPWVHGVWQSNINVVTDDDPEHCDYATGGWPYRAELCKVYKAKQY